MSASRPKPRRLDGRRAQARGTGREQLLDAAEELLAERGYHGTSVDAIVAAAGLTKGAFYWSFDSKEELLIALLEDRLDRQARALMALTGGATGEQTTSQAVSQGLARVAADHRQVVLLMNEFWGLAARDKRLRTRWIRRQRALRAEMAGALKARHETTGVPLTVPPEQLATAVLALGEALAMQSVVDPESVPDGLFGQMLQLWYDGLARRAERG